MTEPTAAISALRAELSQAIRRDYRLRAQRRKALRVGCTIVLALAALSSAALAAGGAFREVETVTPVGEVELPQNVTIQAVDSFPEFVGRATSNGFATSKNGPGAARYIYHVTGGEARDIGCGYPQVPTNNIYITSTRPLSEQEIRSLLSPTANSKSTRPDLPGSPQPATAAPTRGLQVSPAYPTDPCFRERQR